MPLSKANVEPLMSAAETQKVLAFLACIVIVSTAAVDLGKYKLKHFTFKLQGMGLTS